MDVLRETIIVLRSLLISSQKVFTIHELNRDFRKSEGFEIPFSRLGYADLRKFLLSIPDVLRIKNSGTIVPVTTNNSKSQHIQTLVSAQKPTKSNQRRRYYRKKPDNRTINQSTRENMKKHQSESKEMEMMAKFKDFALDVITEEVPSSLNEDDPIHSNPPLSLLDVSIPNPSLSRFESRCMYNICVTEIHRPSRFWFTLCDNDEMKTMEEQLMWYYKDNPFTTNESAMIAGQLCAAFYKHKWLRAECIEAQPLNNKIIVCFVDYGTIDTVATSQCRPLIKDFSSIPKRCFSGALEFVESMENRDVELRLVHHFCEMARDKPLIGWVSQVDDKNQVVRMVLIDTADEKEDIVINRELLTVSKS